MNNYDGYVKGEMVSSEQWEADNRIGAVVVGMRVEFRGDSPLRSGGVAIPSSADTGQMGQFGLTKA